jgi:arylformamidase
MRIFDISVTISPKLPVWPGDPKAVLERVNKLEEGANANVSRLDIGVHTGTHVDAPYHFLPDGKPVETLALDLLIGPAAVIQIPDTVAQLDAGVLEQAGIPTGTVRVLYKTRNSHYWDRPEDGFQTGFAGITEDGASFLVDRGIRLVGIDYLSIAPYKMSRPTHLTLLRSEMIVIEGLDLRSVDPGSYMLYCLPLKLGDTEGAPARVVLTMED